MATAAALGALVTIAGQVNSYLTPVSNTPYRPSRWNEIGVTTITVPSSSSTTQDQATGNISVTKTDATVYVFDGDYRREHSLHAVKTRHPSQTGAAPTDHIYLEPQQLTLEIFQNDTMASYTPGAWTNGPTKSISAYQVLEKLWRARVPLTISTRLKSYANMAVIDIHVVDDASTQFGLRAVVTFEELVFASVVTQTVSARPQATDSTNQGTQGVTAPSSSLLNQHYLSPFPTSSVPGAGDWSSDTGS